MRPDTEGDAPHPVAMSASEVLRKFGSCLTPYEKTEITSYATVYYCGQDCGDKIIAPKSGPNYGFDTSEGEYIFRPKDHIAYRYEILEELGSGAFGQVLKAIDHVDEQLVAVKLIRNRRNVLRQAVQEIKILEHVKARDPKNLYGVVRMVESFSFRGHTCISYELLGANLYDYLKARDFYPMSLSVIRGVAARMLVALTFLGHENIMHCDLKPENILIRGSDPSVVKLVDLGSASFDADNSFMYIQSRFYRAPEVILEQKYTKAIDWWSFGCILCELANGDPLFPGDDEKDQLSCIMEYLGPPPRSFVEASSARRKCEFFDEHMQPRQRQTKNGHPREPHSKSLAKFLGVSEDDDFFSFVMQFLQWDPAARVSPRDAMRHKWICNEFVFPTKAEDKSTAAATPKAEAACSGPSAETKDNDKSAGSQRSAHGRGAWQASNGADTGATVTSATRSLLEPTTRKMRSDTVPGDGHHAPGGLSVPPPSASNDGNETRATAQSTSGAPRRLPAPQRRSAQAFRGRQRRSTDMTDVMVPGEAAAFSRNGSEASPTGKTHDFLVAAGGSDASALTSGSVASHNLPRSGEPAAHAASAPKPGVLSLTALATPVFPPVATPVQLQPRQRVAPHRVGDDPAGDAAAVKDASHPVVATTALLSPRSNANSGPSTPSSAERGSRVLELRRKFESTHVAPTVSGKEHLVDSGKSGINNSSALRFANVAGFSPGEKDARNGSMSTSVKQRSMEGSEPEPTAPPRAAAEQTAAVRRKEYSLTIDGTPTPSPLECTPAVERLRAYAMDYIMPSEMGHDTMNRGFSFLSSSRPYETTSSFIVTDKHKNCGHTEEVVRSSGETMLSSPPNGQSGFVSTISVGANTIAPRRVTRRAIPSPRDDGIGNFKGRQVHEAAPGATPAEGTKRQRLLGGGMRRLAPPRQPLVQRQHQRIITTLTDGKEPSSLITVLPPLKDNPVR